MTRKDRQSNTCSVARKNLAVHNWSRLYVSMRQRMHWNEHSPIASRSFKCARRPLPMADVGRLLRRTATLLASAHKQRPEHVNKHQSCASALCCVAKLACANIRFGPLRVTGNNRLQTKKWRLQTNYMSIFKGIRVHVSVPVLSSSKLVVSSNRTNRAEQARQEAQIIMQHCPPLVGPKITH